MVTSGGGTVLTSGANEVSLGGRVKPSVVGTTFGVVVSTGGVVTAGLVISDDINIGDDGGGGGVGLS